MLLSTLALYNGYRSIDDKAVSGEADHYLAMAYNFFKYRTFSIDTSDHGHPPVTASREPGLPFYLAVSMAVHPGIPATVSLGDLKKDGDAIRRLKYAQLPILAIIALCSMYMVIAVTGNIYLGCLALVMTGFSPSLIRTLGTMHTEALAALLALCVGMSMYKIFEQQKVRYFVLLGFALAGVALTRAQFMYLVLFVLCLLWYGAYRNVFKDKKTFYVGLTAFITIYALIVGGWIGRNYVHLKLPRVSERGSIVLLVRAEKNMMNTMEYLGSFIYYPFLSGGFFHVSPSNSNSKVTGWIEYIRIKRAQLNDYFNLGELIKEGGVLGRLNRLNDSAFIKIAGEEYAHIKQKYATSPDATSLIEKETEELARRKILAHPVRHMLATLPFAFRGMFFEVPVKSPHFRPFELLGVLLMIANLIYLPALLFLAFRSIKLRMWPLLAFIVPALYLFAVHAFFTHYIPRYSYSMMPILVVSALISFHMIIGKHTWQGKRIQ